jgi:hypothetical protein
MVIANGVERAAPAPQFSRTSAGPVGHHRKPPRQSMKSTGEKKLAEK